VEEAVSVFERQADAKQPAAWRFPSGQIQAPCGCRKSCHPHHQIAVAWIYPGAVTVHRNPGPY
jgi:hypothetical protein